MCRTQHQKVVSSYPVSQKNAFRYHSRLTFSEYQSVPTIVFANSKGGSGKSTAALLLATELALETRVAVVDADIRRRIAKWAAAGNGPSNLVVFGDVTEINVIDRIDAAADEAPIVVVDLEGTASKLVLLAISQAGPRCNPTPGLGP